MYNWVITIVVSYILISLGLVNEAIIYGCLHTIINYAKENGRRKQKDKEKKILEEQNNKVIFFEKEKELRKKIESANNDIIKTKGPN